MKRLLITIALAAFAISSLACAATDDSAAKTTPAASPSAPAESAADIEKALRKMEVDWMEAIKNKDRAAFESILADDFVSIGWQGVTRNKAESLASNLASDSKLESYTLDPLKVRIYGDTAVVTGGDTEKSSEKGKDTSGQYTWTDVYVKRNGRWQAVSTHSSRLPQMKK